MIYIELLWLLYLNDNEVFEYEKNVILEIDIVKWERCRKLDKKKKMKSCKSILPFNKK